MSAKQTKVPNQLSGSMLGMLGAVVGAVSSALVTTALKSNILVDKTFNVAIHGVSAAEYIAAAGEERAQIYGEHIKANGSLAEKEMAVRHHRRLMALLDEQSSIESDSHRPVKGKPAKRTTAKAA